MFNENQMINKILVKNELEIAISNLMKELQLTTKKYEAQGVYKAIRELLHFGNVSGLLGDMEYNILAEAARDALPFNR